MKPDFLTTQALVAQLPVRLLPWYAQNARVLPWRTDCLPYHVWVSEIMLQQTRVEAVRQYYVRFLQQCPSVEALADTQEDQLNKLWEGLGYYSRVRNMKKAAQEICVRYGGSFPRTYNEIVALPGIGPYTAGAICSICFGLPEPAVDGNVLRVLSRLLADTSPINKPALKANITDALRRVYPAGQCGAFTQSLMELGALVCLPNGAPSCMKCPLQEICRAKAQGSQQNFPVKQRKPPRRREEKTLFILQCGTMQAVQKRPSSGLLAGLWEYPNVEGTLNADQAIKQVERWQAHPNQLVKKICKSHIFTHVVWHMTAYYIQCNQMPPCFSWVDFQQMEQEIALPTAFGMFRPKEDL